MAGIGEHQRPVVTPHPARNGDHAVIGKAHMGTMQADPPCLVDGPARAAEAAAVTPLPATMTATVTEADFDMAMLPADGQRGGLGRALARPDSAAARSRSRG